MNLEELQIKIGIELKELNKQLKKASDDINEYIGPKATKKMMSDNNKAIKRGLDEISRTTKYSMKKLHKDTTKEVDDMSKDINKSLTEAFDIDKTLVKFNKDINRSMEQAKRSVRSACNDIRRELNAALNIKANIRVSASTSASRQSSGSRGDTASIIASVQYNGAMIVKAINGMININIKNTIRLENAINKSTDKIIAVITKSGKTNEREQKPRRAKVIIPKEATTTTKGKTVGQPYGPDNRALISALKNTYKAINILNRNLSALNALKNIKQLGTGSNAYGHNGMQGGTVNWKKGRQGATTTSFKGEVVNPVAATIPVEPFKQVQDIIEVINYEIKDFETALVKVNSRAVSVVNTLKDFRLSNTGGYPLRGEVIDSGKLTQNKGIPQKEVIIPAKFKVIDDELQQQINDAVKKIKIPKLLNTKNFELGKEGKLDTSQVEASRQVQELKKKINSTPLGLNAPMDVSSQIQDLNTYGERVGAIIGNIGEVYRKLNDGSMLLTSAKKCIDYNVEAVFDLIESLNKIEDSDAFAHLSQDAQQHLKAMKMALISCSDALFDLNEKVVIDFNARGKDPKARGLSTNTNEPIDIKVNDDAAKKLESIKEQIGEIRQEFDFMANEELVNFGIDENLFKEQFGSIEEYASDLYDLYESLQKLDDERIKLDIDTEDAKKQIKELQEIIATYIDSISNGEFKDNIKATLNIPERTQGTKPNKPNKSGKPPKPTIMGFGFGAFKNEIDAIGKALKEIFDPNIGPAKLDKALSSIGKTARKVADAITNGIGKSLGTVGKGITSIAKTADKVLTKVAKSISHIIGIFAMFPKALIGATKVTINFFKKSVEKIGLLGSVIKYAGMWLKAFETSAKVMLKATLGPLYDLVIDKIELCIEAIKKLGRAIANVAKTIKDAIVNVVVRAFEFLEEKLNKLINIIKRVGKAIADIAKKIKDALVSAISNAIDFVIDKFDKLVNVIKKVATAIVNVAKDIKDTLVIAFLYAIDYIEDKFKKLVSVIKKVTTTIKNIVKDIKDTLVIAFLYAIDYIEDKFNKLVNVIKKVGKAIADLATRIKNYLMIAFAYIADVVEDAINKCINAIKRLGRAIVDVAKKIKDVLANAVNKAIDFIVDKFEKLIEAVKRLGRAIANVAKQIKNALVNAVSVAIDFVADKFDKLVEAIKAVGRAISSVVTRIKNSLMITFAHVIDVIEDKFNSLKTIISNIYGHIVNLSRAYDIVIRRYLGKIASYMEGLANKIVQPLKTAMSKVATVIKNQYNQIAAAIKLSINNVIGSTKNMYNQVAAAIKLSINNIVTATKNQYNQVSAAVKTTIGNIATAAKNQYNHVAAAIEMTINNITTSIENQYNQVAAAIKHSFNKIVTPVKSAVTNIKNTTKDVLDDAQDFAKRFFNKVNNYSLSTAQKIKTATKSAVSSVKAISKEKITNVVDVNKVKDGFNKVKQAGKDTADSIRSSFSGVIDSFGERKKDGSLKIPKVFKPKDPKQPKTQLFKTIEASKLYNSIAKALGKSKAAITRFANSARATLNKVFTNIKAGKLHGAVSRTLGKAKSSISRFVGVARAKLNSAFSGIKSNKIYSSVSKALNKAKAAVSKFAGKVRPILNKAFTGIKVAKVASTISKGLSKAKGALSKFANGCKTIWGKIKGIFSKGASDASKATGKLTTGLKALLAQAMGFFSLYALINLGKQAITQSGQLAQAESKLTSLMRQRMGATNETVKAIRQLASEQAKLGVVSETAMVRGAEQLSRYVSSAKALQTLIPAIANMTALRGGLFATEDDAEEIATQLGEAIREGTTTPLEQSGIYLSEKEIEKFKALRTEEERAAYLADVIAKNVGNLNEQLANTPHGAIAQLRNNFKSLLGTLGTLLVNVIQPIVKWLNVVVVAANNALKSLGELLGFDMTGGGLAGLGDVGTTGTTPGENTKDIKDSFDDTKDSIDAATEANEKFKGSLMGFDEINTLSDNTNKNSDSGSEELDPTDISAIGGQLIPTEITEGESIFEKFGEKIKAFMDEILEPFKNAWDLLGERWKQEWNDLLQSCANFTTSLGNFLKSVWDNGGKEFVQHLAEIGLACGIAAMEIGGEILDSLARLWDHLDPSKNMNTQGFLNALNEVSVKVRDFVLGLGDHFESLMANGGQDVLNSLGDMCMNFGEAATRGFGVAIDALDGLIDHLDPANNDFTKDMLKAWEGAFDSVGQCALDFAGLLESTLVNGGQEIINSLGDLGMKVGEAFGVLVDECAQTLSELFKHMDPATNPHSKKMLESIDGLIDSVTGFVDACIQAFKKFMDSGGRDFVKNLGDILAIVIDLAAELGSGIIDIITGFMNSWAGQALIEGVAQALKWVTEKLVGLSDAFDVVKDIFRNIVDIIVGIFEGDGEKVGRAFANLIKNAFKLTGELLQWLLDLGLDLVKGLIKGICALPKLLWEAVKFLFDTIVGFFKELFGIHSPSTVFAELGGFLIEGLVNGITGAIKLVTDAFKKIGETILNAAKDIIKNVSEKFKDMKETIKEKLNEAKEVVSEKWKDMKETVSEKAKEIYNTTKEKWNDVKQTISEKAKESYEVAKENWTNIKQTVSEKTKEAYDSIKENWKNIKQTAVDIFTGTYETTKEKWSNIKDTIADKTKSAYESAKDKWADIKQVTTDRFKESYETIKDRFTNIKDTVKEKATKTYEDVSDAWTKIKEDAGKKLDQIKTDAESRYKDVKDVMVSKVNEAKEGIVAKWEEVRTKTNECIENVKTTAENSYNNVKETIAKKLDEVKSNTSSKWEEIKKNTSESVENIRKEAEERYGKIKESLTNTLEQTKSDMSTKWENIKKDAIDKAQKIASEATTKFAEIKNSFAKKLEETRSSLTSKWDALKTQASTSASGMVSKAKSGLSNMGQTIADAITSGKSKVNSALNEIGKLISGVKWNFPEIKLPKLPKLKIEWNEIPGNSWFSAIKYPKLSWNARGGIIDGITPLGFANGALQMGGEAGKEMVVPLENTSFTTKIAQAMGQAVDNAMARNYKNMSNNNNNSFNDNRDVVLQVDGREFARASINSINKLQRESGRTLLDI